jgi:flagellar FliJ protein
MRRSKRMQPVAEMAQQHAQDAAQNLAIHQQRFYERQAQLDELVAYRDDYALRLQQRGMEGLNAMQMQDYNLFLGRLNRAIDHQQDALKSASLELDNKRRVWEEKHQNSMAIVKVVNRHLQQEQRDATHQDQRESDDRPGQSARKEAI